MRIAPSKLALFIATSSKSFKEISSFQIRSTNARLLSTAFIRGEASLNRKSPKYCSFSKSSHLYFQPNESKSRVNMSTSAASLPLNEDTPNTKVALLQFRVTDDKENNHNTAKTFLKKAHEAQASLCVLPEIWNSPYATPAFAEYAEVLPDVGYQYSAEADGNIIDSPSAKLLFEAAMEYKMYIIGGSIPEKNADPSNDKVYNTCLCISPSGKLIAKHRKVHLFDIDVPGGIRFMESDTLSPGNTLSAFSAGTSDTSFGNIGVGICYDIRFPEYAMMLTKKHSCNLLVYPGAFNMTTGPAHWELLQRARAVDNQCFVLTASPARTEAPEVEGKYKHYTAWGHSTVINPWGEVVGTCSEGEDIVVVDLEIEDVKKMREGIPVSKQKRDDMYQLVDGTNA